MNKTWKKGLSIAGIILFVCLIIFYNSIAPNFSKDNPKGELFKVILTSLGGIGVFYGLLLNSKRIRQQTEQNRISENSNSDKRFSDAIGYFSSDNTTTILGGVYALYQLAKEDQRYRSIVANLLCSYLKEKSHTLYPQNLPVFNAPILIQTIIDVLFDGSTFMDEQLDLSNTLLQNVLFKNEVTNCNFSQSRIYDSLFKKRTSDSNFGGTEITNCYFCNDTIDCIFIGSKLIETYFDKQIDDEKTSIKCNFDFATFSQCKFSNMNFSQTTFRETNVNSVIISFCKMNDTLFDLASCNDFKFMGTDIPETTIFTNSNSINLKGNISFDTFVKNKPF
jgi:uncharacterized protein YjbI with pentapeptide repeats